MACKKQTLAKKTSPLCFHSPFNLAQSVRQHGTRKATKNGIFDLENTARYGLRSVRYYGATCRNKIPMDIKNSLSAVIFRRRLKVFL